MRLTKLVLSTALLAAGTTMSLDAVAGGTTDGFHSIQVFPVAVDTATFTQRFVFSNPGSTVIPVEPRYFPGVGTAQDGVGAITCPSFNIPASGQIVFASLRAMCPALVAGSNFGLLYTFETAATNLPFAAYSRVSNFAGNGFSVESYAPSEFTGTTSRVTGVRRLAATLSAPAYQTNCFIANLNEITPVGASNTTTVRVFNSAGTQQGASTPVTMVPGKMTRLLDVFDAVGAPVGDYNDASVTFANGTRQGIISFCTVQDNTSFGADLRIGKAWSVGRDSNDSFSSSADVPQGGTLDDMSWRTARLRQDRLNTTTTTMATRTWTVPANVSTNATTHVFYFRHPDWVQCEIIDPATGILATTAYGLEMRMLDIAGNVIAGGDNIAGFGEIYLGDKVDRNNGANGRYYIQVENNGQNLAANRPYQVRCQSGSGTTLGDVIEYQATERF